MPLEVKNQTSKAAKIKEYLDNLLSIFEQSISLSDDDAEAIIKKIQYYDLSPVLNFKLGPDIDNSCYNQFIFCDLLLPSTNKSIASDAATRTFTFLKTQMPLIVKILEPLVKANQAVYVLSELDAINYDIDDTLSSDDVTTLNYLVWDLTYENGNVRSSQIIKSNKFHPLLQLSQAINNPLLINEIADPGDFDNNFNNMPMLIPSLQKTFPHITADILKPLISYLQLVANNQNHIYL